jgi:hypothetical protein
MQVFSGFRFFVFGSTLCRILVLGPRSVFSSQLTLAQPEEHIRRHLYTVIINNVYLYGTLSVEINDPTHLTGHICVDASHDEEKYRNFTLPCDDPTRQRLVKYSTQCMGDA